MSISIIAQRYQHVPAPRANGAPGSVDSNFRTRIRSEACRRARALVVRGLVWRVLAIALVSASVLASAAGASVVSPAAAGSANTPAAVSQGLAVFRSHYNPTSTLNINVGLAVRHSAELDQLIDAVSTPGNPRYGHYLTQAQYRAEYAPTAAQAQAIRAFLTTRGLRVTGVSPDNLLVEVRATAGPAERAFNVAINIYSYRRRTFFANSTNPSVPAGLDVQHVSGLSNYDVFKPLITCTPNPGSRVRLRRR